MAGKNTYKVQFRRRIEGKTNYKKRLALLKSGLHRLVVRKTNKYVKAQVIGYDPKGDMTIVDVTSKQLEKLGWKAGTKSLPAAYLTGLLAGKKAKEAKVEKAILDIGFAIPKRKGWWGAALKGAIDSGLEIEAGEEALPAEERIMGKHIEEYSKSEAEGNMFSKVGKQASLSKTFEEVKQKILKAN